MMYISPVSTHGSHPSRRHSSRRRTSVPRSCRQFSMGSCDLRGGCVGSRSSGSSSPAGSPLVGVVRPVRSAAGDAANGISTRSGTWNEPVGAPDLGGNLLRCRSACQGRALRPPGVIIPHDHGQGVEPFQLGRPAEKDLQADCPRSGSRGLACYPEPGGEFPRSGAAYRVRQSWRTPRRPPSPLRQPPSPSRPGASRTRRHPRRPAPPLPTRSTPLLPRPRR